MCHNSDQESMESLRAQMDADPVALLSKFFDACNTEEFLSNPIIVDFLIALSGQHRGGCFDNIVTDINLPKNLWQITFGEELHPNIYSEMPMR